MRRLTLSAGVAMAAVALAPVAGIAAAQSQHADSGTIKAAWIYVGPHNDGGWSQAHDKGRLAVEKALGDKVETTFKEIVPEGPQATQVIESLIRDGNKIIFATSFGYQNQMKAAAKKYPNVYFEHATGTFTSKNMSQYFGAGEDGIYLAGIAAGAASKTGKIGMVLPFGIPEVIRHANAFLLGAQTVKPNATLRVVFTNSWFDPTKEKQAAESLLAAKVDVLGQNVDSPATGEAAKAAGVPWVGYDSDASGVAPKVWQTASVYNWGPYYTKRVRAAMDGTWKTGTYYGDLKDGFIGLAKFGPTVTAKTKGLIAAKRKAMVGGSFKPFNGPIVDQAGKVRIAKGKTASYQDLLTMTYFVKGVIGKVPKQG